jgi:hypothetical protein
MRLLLQQQVQQIRRVTQCAGNNQGVEAHVLVRDTVVPGQTTFTGEVLWASASADATSPPPQAFAIGMLACAATSRALARASVSCRDTLIRLVRRHELPAPATPRILGVDDWAQRNGHTSGSILVDIEQGEMIDLLSDRAPETFAQWRRDPPAWR